MKSVAAAAGVGLGTVSRVLSNKGYVAEATRQRVEAAARELNYRPSALGRGLKRKRTDTIGLIVADISNQFYGDFAEGVLGAARVMNRHVVVGSSAEDPENEFAYIELLLEQRVDGIIAFPSGGNEKSWRAALDLGVSVVFADRTMPGIAVPAVVVDNEDGTRRLTEYLIGLGHRRIGYLGGPVDVSSGRLREEGFRRAHAAAGLRLEEVCILRHKFTRESTYESALELLRRAQPITAVIAANNVFGEALLAALTEGGYSIPADMSIAMVDDMPWARLTRPPVTVLAQPTTELGRAAVSLVTSSTARNEEVELATQLIVRGSTGVPRSLPRT